VRPAARARRERAGDRQIAALYTGTSGFSYATWKGRFYPRSLAGARMLAYYGERLNGLEVNGSFYRMPPTTTLEKWAATVPAGFRFCMKASRGLTYSAAAFDKVGLARIFAERVAPLGDSLGPVLLQFPPTRQRDAGLLDSLLGALGGRVACEFRHASWFDPETYEVIGARGGALVVTDEEKWPRAPQVALGPVAYFRLRRGYTYRALEPWLEAIRSASAAHDEVHVYFKHDPQAPRLALHVRSAFAGSGKGSPRRRSAP
jgi:uncharacterized protein YecE (DUF72 family)